MALDVSTLLLTVRDNLDGTVDWTATGGVAGRTVVLLQAPWNPAAGGRAVWTQLSSGVADGAGTATGAALAAGGYGFYLWGAAQLATSTTADMIAGTIFRPVVDPTDPVHNRVLDAVVTMIRSLNLDGIGSAANKVFKRWHPNWIPGHDDSTAAGGGGLPAVIVGPYPNEIPLGVMTNKDDVGYPAMVAFYDAMNPLFTANMGRDLKWRRQTAALFRSQQLAGVPEVVITDWKPDLIASPEGLKSNYLVGAHTFLFRSRESRGAVA